MISKIDIVINLELLIKGESFFYFCFNTIQYFYLCIHCIKLYIYTCIDNVNDNTLKIKA